jgi:hypothetical protein
MARGILFSKYRRPRKSFGRKVAGRAVRRVTRPV